MLIWTIAAEVLKNCEVIWQTIFKIIIRKLLADSTEYGVSGDDPRGDRNTKGNRRSMAGFFVLPDWLAPVLHT